jgi:hypothetical protein
MGFLMPRRMMISYARKLSYYYRSSPDGTRILFGGRGATLAGGGRWYFDEGHAVGAAVNSTSGPLRRAQTHSGS